MLPGLKDIGGPWKVLPPGIHDVTLPEIERAFATTDRRRAMFEGFKRAAKDLKKAGCSTVYLDGSFVTEKQEPGDFDACWEPAGVDDRRLDPVLLDFTDHRRAQKKRYMGELFPAPYFAAPGQRFIDFFQNDRYTGKPKGILRIRL
jgi:hypothetical protein